MSFQFIDIPHWVFEKYGHSRAAPDYIEPHFMCRCKPIVGVDYGEKDKTVFTVWEKRMSDKIKMRFLRSVAKPLELVAQAIERGWSKHGDDFNWRDTPRDEHVDSLSRHFFDFLGGSKRDKDSGLHPLAHVITRALFILWQDSQPLTATITLYEARPGSVQALFDTLREKTVPKPFLPDITYSVRYKVMTSVAGKDLQVLRDNGAGEFEGTFEEAQEFCKSLRNLFSGGDYWVEVV